MATKWTAEDLGDLSGRTYVITGANSGIGFEATLGLVGAGARVIMACRNPSKGAAALEHIRTLHPGALVEVLPLDLASLASIRTFADELAGVTTRVDALINNAGLIGIRGDTEDGFEMTIGVNHLGHFALTGLVLPLLEQTAKSGVAPRIVSVASIAYRWFGKMHWDDLEFRNRRWSTWPVYGQSKLANLLFTFELNRRLVESGSAVRAMACHPGMSSTNLILAGAEAKGQSFIKGVLKLGSDLTTQPAWKGALPTIYAAVHSSVGGADYVGPHGLVQTRGWPVKVEAGPKAHSQSDWLKLWDWSVERTGIAYLD
jgi:NAD(P)-dependent dehydrogenase (short-subunit alcohol dehydrogenase family)